MTSCQVNTQSVTLSLRTTALRHQTLTARPRRATAMVGMVHSISGWMWGVRSLENACHTRAP